MRLDDNILVVSERNLLTLLTKLYTADSACEIEGGVDCPMSIRAESDAAHYGDRDYGPGPMHPVTEQVMQAVRAATKDARIDQELAASWLASFQQAQKDERRRRR